MPWVLVATPLIAVAIAFVLRLPPALMGLWPWLGLALLYAGLGVLALLRLRRAERRGRLLVFRPGDPSLGIGLGVLLLLGAWALSRWLLPFDSAAHAWVLRISLVIGGASSASITACLLAIAALEELVWRGWLQTELSERLGVRRGWVACALAYAAAHAATLFTLSDPVAGPNPLIVLMALGCGLCWGFLRERTGRIMPGLFSHLAFTYLATQHLVHFL